MLRRIHVRHLSPGKTVLETDQAHHLRDVLRLLPGAQVEVFDDAGNTADAALILDNNHLAIQVDSLRQITPSSLHLSIASAIPKGERADWMIEKLSELGVHRFIPLAAQRSVVIPSGKNKIDRWLRIAVESAKQSRRIGVMEIVPMSSPSDLIADSSQSDNSQKKICYLSTQPASTSLIKMLNESNPITHLTLLVGPEGGWTESETTAFEKASFAPLTLGPTTLRIETASLAAAAIIASFNAKK